MPLSCGLFGMGLRAFMVRRLAFPPPPPPPMVWSGRVGGKGGGAVAAAAGGRLLLAGGQPGSYASPMYFKTYTQP